MCRYLIALLIPLSIAGCGGGLEQFPVAKVTGKVLCDGKPVPDVRIVFGPIAGDRKDHQSGKSAFGVADEDGAFELSTYGDLDGAVVGKHRVIVMTPDAEEAPNFNCNCETSGKSTIQEVEVAADGDNNFTINLPPKADRSKPSIDPQDLADAAPSPATSSPDENE